MRKTIKIMIKKVIFLLFALTVISVSGAGAQTGVHDNDPVADQRAVVEAGNARFTVLTQRMIRMEWSADGQFEDRAPLVILNLCLPLPEFMVSLSNSKVTIQTADVTLIYY